MKHQVTDKRASVMFIHSVIDDYGLDVYAFRVYARLVRRAGTHGNAYESVANMADACCMSESKCQRSLKKLTDIGLISAEVRAGATTIYSLNSIEKWQKIEDTNPSTSYTPVPDTAHPSTTYTPTPVPRTPEVNPLEGNPLKENTTSSAKPTSIQFEDYLQAWNNNRGPLRKATKLNQWRKQKIKAHHRENKHEALHMFTIATQQVANNDYWIEQNYGIDTLLRNKILTYYEQAQAQQTTLTPTPLVDFTQP